MADNVLYRVDVDISQVKSKLGLIDKEFKKLETGGTQATRKIGTQGTKNIQALSDVFQLLGVRGSFAFGRIIGTAGAAGVAIGALIVTINLVSKAIQTMGRLAKEALVGATTASFETGKEFDALKAQLTAVFEGAPAAADAAFTKIRSISKDLGFDATQLARAFIPEVESLDQLEKIVELGAALARFQPEQGVTGARIALQGALEGTNAGLRSLQRFELTKESLGRIKQLQEELGAVDGLIKGLGDELQRTGRDLDALSGTFEVGLGKAKEFLRDLQGVAGEPIIDQLIEEFDVLNGLLNDNEAELSVIANAFGEAVASIIEKISDLGQKLFENLDEEQALELANAITDIGISLETLVDLIAGGFDESGFDSLLKLVQFIRDEISGLVLAIAQLKPAIAGLSAVASEVSKLNRAVLLAKSGNFSGAQDIFQGIDFSNVQDAYNTELLDSIGIATDYALSIRDARDANEEFADSFGKDLGDSNLTDSILAAKQQAEELAALDAEAADARATVAEKQEKFTIDKERARLDLIKKQRRAEIDLEIELSQKREDIERKNLEKIQDIHRKHAERLAAAATDLQRDQEDIVLKFARKQEDIDVETADNRIKIEQDFRREMEEIRRKFEFDAQEAIRANDAIAFLRIQRRSQFEIQEAKEKKKEETTTVTEEAAKQQQELARLREREIEDARIANARQLEDLQVRLANELQAQAINHQRELEQLHIAEERKREELRINAQRELQDFNEKWQRKLEDLQRNLQKELEILQRAEAQKAQILARSRARARAAAQAASADRVLLQNYGGNNPRRIDTPRNRQEAAGADQVLTQNFGGGRRFGGPVFPGRRYLVGEAGPELFLPGKIGSIFPLRKTLNSLLFSPPAAGRANRGTIINNRNSRMDLSMLDPSTFSPQQIQIIRRVVTQIMADVL